MHTRRVAVVGAGIGGLVAALELAARGFEVVVLEQAQAPGGKMRETPIAAARIDAGPTVLTMRWVFDEIFATAGAVVSDHLELRRAEVLARHAWSGTERLDLYADLGRSADAIGAFAGAGEARRFLEFSARARTVYRTLEGPFIRSARPSPLGLTRTAGMKGLGDLWRISPFTTLWRALGQHFHDPRLRQLFGRYATYCGSSPFQAPATLMLVAHVEQEGVWLVEGGMHRIALALATLATARGATFRYGAEVAEVVTHGERATGLRLASGEHIDADAVIVNADVAAVAAGRLGAGIAPAATPLAPGARSLSAVTWAVAARTEGFPLQRHNVFFSRDYPAEFEAIFQRGQIPAEPTVYVCAQDRGDSEIATTSGPERLLCLVNAPALGDVRAFDANEINRAEEHAFGVLARCGLHVDRTQTNCVVTTPADFERLFPGTGGALYGRASHGWNASFQRADARTRLSGLYLAGGSVHPGPGVPMAALSGRLAAKALLEDARAV
ncbi:MAG: 1-hydroxycarotenoid 3,4-desaturase CrtD [Betaproteobacteria bacterium]